MWGRAFTDCLRRESTISQVQNKPKYMSIVADVNRLDPNATSKLTGPDYANMAKEVAEMCLHPSRGLPQIYEVIRQATKK